MGINDTKLECLNKETEYKVMLSKEKYEELEHLFVWKEVCEQTNYYYLDSKRKLAEHNITVRIRESENKYKLQVKMPIYDDKALKVKEEYEEPVDKVLDIISGKKISQICQIELNDLKMIGKLSTLRKTFNYNRGILICLDENKYFDLCDYELEIEFNDFCEKTLINLFNEHGVYMEQQSRGKLRRFLDYYDNLK